MTTQELISTMREGRQHWDDLLRTIGFDHMTQEGANGTWSVKDVIAHITGWDQWTTARIKANLTGTLPSDIETYGHEMPDEVKQAKGFDTINAWFVQTHAHLTPEQTLQESDYVFGTLLTAISSIPDSDLTDPDKTFIGFEWRKDRPLWKILLEMTVEHYEHHAKILSAWQENQSTTGSNRQDSGNTRQ